MFCSGCTVFKLNLLFWPFMLCDLLNLINLTKDMSIFRAVRCQIILSGKHNAVCPHTQPHTHMHIFLQIKSAMWIQWWKNTFIEVHEECKKTVMEAIGFAYSITGIF